MTLEHFKSPFDLGFKNETGLNMDNMSVNSTLVLQFTNKDEPKSNIALVPIDAFVKFKAKSRQGYKMMFGVTQEIKVQDIEFGFEVGKCQTAPIEAQLNF